MKRNFAPVDDYEEDTAELSVSLDVLYHLVGDDELERDITGIFDAATRYVFVYSINTDAEPTRVRQRTTKPIEICTFTTMPKSAGTSRGESTIAITNCADWTVRLPPNSKLELSRNEYANVIDVRRIELGGATRQSARITGKRRGRIVAILAHAARASAITDVTVCRRLRARPTRRSATFLWVALPSQDATVYTLATIHPVCATNPERRSRFGVRSG